MKLIAKYWPYLVTAIIFLVLYLVGREFSQEDINEFISRVGFWGPLVLLLLLVLVNIIAPLSNSPIIFAGFYAYGKWIIALTLFAGLITAITNFYIGKYLGRRVVTRLIGERNIKRADKFIESNGLLMLFVLRVFQGAYFDYLSYVFGMSSLRFTPYIIVTLLGFIPGGLLWYLISLKTDTAVEFIAASLTLGTVMSVIFFIGFFVVEFVKRKTKTS